MINLTIIQQKMIIFIHKTKRYTTLREKNIEN